MGKKLTYFTMILALTFSALACNLSAVDLSGGSKLPPEILFQDNFSDPSSGWDLQTSPEFETGYRDGGFVISIKAASTMAWSKPGLGFSDVVIETDTVKIGGLDDNSFGIICRYTEMEAASSFYFFVISSDGFYGIGKVTDGRQELISSDNMEYNSAIQQGSRNNHLQAECVGNQLVLRVNGQELASTTDDSFTAGDVGLMAGAFSASGTEIFFDNFSVKEPPVLSDE